MAGERMMILKNQGARRHEVSGRFVAKTAASRRASHNRVLLYVRCQRVRLCFKSQPFIFLRKIPNLSTENPACFKFEIDDNAMVGLKGTCAAWESASLPHRLKNSSERRRPR